MKKLQAYYLKSLLLIWCISFFKLQAQETLTPIAEVKPTVVVKSNDTIIPKKAMIYSICLPGLGQAYNKKYWKIPIIYAGLGTSAYFFVQNLNQVKIYKDELNYRLENKTRSEKFAKYTDLDIILLKDAYTRNRDLSGLVFVTFYVLNFVDAYVDAHLNTFEQIDNLCLRISPSINTCNYQTNIGINISWKFK